MSVKPRVLFFSIAAGHLALLGLFLIQPGCQAPQPSAPVAATNPSLTAPSGQAVPTRPTTPSAAMPAPTSTVTPTVLDPAFNANLPVSQPSGSGFRAPPTRPSDRPLARDFEEPLAPLAPVVSEAQSRAYTVRPGDTLTAIARREGVTIDSIRDANNLTSDTLFPDQTLIIPGEAAPALSPVTTPDAAGQRYVVQPGDTLSGIAARAGVRVDALRRANDLRSDIIQVDQVLFIPLAGETSVADLPARPTPPPASVALGDSYVVQPGETLGAIARRFGTTVRAIQDANGISDPRLLQAGQTLVIPGAGTRTPTASAPRPTPVVTTPPPRREPAAPPRPTAPPPTLQSQPSEPEILENVPFDRLEALEEMDLPFVEVQDVPVDEEQSEGGPDGE